VSLRAERSGAKQSFSIKIASSQKTLLAMTHIFTIKNLVNNVVGVFIGLNKPTGGSIIISYGRRTKEAYAHYFFYCVMTGAIISGFTTYIITKILNFY